MKFPPLGAAAFLSLGLAASSAAAAPRPARAVRAHPTCPEGQAATLTGHPFLPWKCLGPGEALDPPAPEPVSVSTPSAALKHPGKAKLDKARSSPKDLAGRWEGILIHGVERLEVLWEIRPKGKEGFFLAFGMKDYHSHSKITYQADLKPGRVPGVYTAVVEFPPYADRLKAEIHFGPVPESGDFDRFAELAYEGRPALHRLLLSRSGKDRIRFRYQDPAPESRPLEGELNRTERPAL